MEKYDNLNDFWTDEFAPKTLDDMVLSDDIRKHILDLLNSKNRFNMLLAGSPGLGKTTLAKLIAKEVNASVLFISCGVEGTVATAQGKVKNFCDSLSMEGKPKLVILDELDSASGTQDNSFQKTLRNIISESPDTMFIGTCNYVEKVIEPIRSRLGTISLKFTGKDLVFRIKKILDEKKISYTFDSLQTFANNVIKKHYPDVRRIISYLQACCSSGSLIVSDEVNNVENTDIVKTLIDKTFSSNNMLEVRQHYLSLKTKIDDYKTFASSIFNYVVDNDLIKHQEHIMKMSDIIYQMNIVVDPEIQFFCLLTLLNYDYRKQ